MLMYFLKKIHAQRYILLVKFLFIFNRLCLNLVAIMQPNSLSESPKLSLLSI